MNLRQLLAGVVFSLVVVVGTVQAAESTVVGRWFYTTNDRQVEMDFAQDGYCAIKIKAGEKNSVLEGSYRVNNGKLTIRPRKGDPIVYNMDQRGDALTLTGGNFANGRSMDLTRQVAADAPRQPRNPAPGTPATPMPIEKPNAEPTPNGNTTTLPGGVWDTRALEQNFNILRTKLDPNTNKVTWLLERTTDGFVAFDISFYDEDGVKLTGDYLSFEPAIASVAKGDRTRATASLMKEDDMKRVKKVVVTKR